MMDDVCWHLERLTAPVELPIDLVEVREDHLHAANGAVEDRKIERLFRTAVTYGERFTRRAWGPQTWALLCDRFPCEFVLPWPPLIEVQSIQYVDDNGDPQTLSPTLYQVSPAVGRRNPYAQKARIRPAYGETWPTTRYQMDAVTVTYEAGYVDTTSPAQPDIPEDLIAGALLVVGELYKVRSESVHTINQNEAVIRARDLWRGYQVP
jgi:uncharacterized phiE125 gp8 family phage protein